jgi:hypothetical protein
MPQVSAWFWSLFFGDEEEFFELRTAARSFIDFYWLKRPDFQENCQWNA